MKNKFLLLLISTSLISVHSFAQVLVQDAQGKTSIMYHGDAVNFDLTQTRATFVINSFGNEYKKNKNRKTFWGGQASANSKNGIAGLVSSTNIVPEGNLNLTFGITETTDGSRIDAIEKMEYSAEKAGELAKRFQTNLEALGKSDPIIKKNNDLQKKIDEVIASTEYEKLAIDIRKLIETNKVESKNIEVLATSIEALIKSHLAQISVLTDDVNAHWDQIQRSWWKRRSLFYVTTGLTASEFIHIFDPNNLDFDKRFKKTNYQSPKIGIGYNLQVGGTDMYGVNLVLQKSNTFSQLESADYTFSSSNTLNTGKLDSKQVFTAYSGNYYTYWQVPISVDWVHFFRGITDERSVLALNVYLRHQFTSDGKYRFTNHDITNLGVGSYFFKDNGILLGGIYLEFQDLANNIESRKEIPKLKPFYNRLNFGIITKFSLNSIISYRPQ